MGNSDGGPRREILRRRMIAFLVAMALPACTTPTGKTGEMPATTGLGGSPLQLPASSPGRPTRLVLISIAGLRPASYLGSEVAGGGMSAPVPILSELSEKGLAALDVRSVLPASTAPALATLVTGLPPAGHGIPADRMLGDRGVRNAAYSHASALKGDPLWFTASEAGLPVAVLGWPTTVGGSIQAIFPDLMPVWPRDAVWERLEGTATPWVLQLARTLAGEDTKALYPGPERDRLIRRMGCAMLQMSEAPRVLLLRFSQTETALRWGGPGSPEAAEAWAGVDAELRGVLRCLTDSDRLETSVLAIAGDHGYAPTHTEISPNRLLAEAELLVVDPEQPGRLTSWSAITRSNGGSAFVYARSEADALEARKVLLDLSARTGLFRVVPAAEMMDSGGDPEAWFGLEAKLGYLFGDSATVPVVRATPQRGGGGYFPDEPSMHPGFVLYGRGVREGVRVPQMNQEDVAPTLARLLGLSQLGNAGWPLIGGMDLAEPAE